MSIDFINFYVSRRLLGICTDRPLDAPAFAVV